jgi:hypothetical protein
MFDIAVDRLRLKHYGAVGTNILQERAGWRDHQLTSKIQHPKMKLIVHL